MGHDQHQVHIRVCVRLAVGIGAEQNHALRMELLHHRVDKREDGSASAIAVIIAFRRPSALTRPFRPTSREGRGESIDASHPGGSSFSKSSTCVTTPSFSVSFTHRYASFDVE